MQTYKNSIICDNKNQSSIFLRCLLNNELFIPSKVHDKAELMANRFIDGN